MAAGHGTRTHPLAIGIENFTASLVRLGCAKRWRGGTRHALGPVRREGYLDQGAPDAIPPPGFSLPARRHLYHPEIHQI
jgi:hypothetical protein